MTGQPTALVLRALGLGDFFTGLAALALLRRSLPEHRIVLVAPDDLDPLVRLVPAVDERLPGTEALAPLVQAPDEPELAIDLHGNGPRSRDVLLARHPERLIAFNYDGIAWLPDEHEVARWCRLVAFGLGLPAGIGYPSVVGALPEPTGVDVPSGLTVLHCGAKSLSRRWPAERFAGLAILLRARGHEVVITGGPAERQLARSIAAAADVRALTGLTLLELTALVARARVVVCGDTGVGHVATNYGTPSVLLFGPVSPLIWGPPADPRHHVLWHGTGTGDPHGDVPDPALLAIDVHQAADAVQRAEAGRAAAGVPAAISA